MKYIYTLYGLILVHQQSNMTILDKNFCQILYFLCCIDELNHQVRIRSKVLVEISLYCEKTFEEDENKISITTESTNLMIFLICKLIQDNVEEDHDKVSHSFKK